MRLCVSLTGKPGFERLLKLTAEHAKNAELL